MQIEIESVTNERAIYGENVLCANVTVGRHSFTFTRYPNESAWLCDSHFTDGWRPIFVHGIGSRCCLKQSATGELEAALNARLQLALI